MKIKCSYINRLSKIFPVSQKRASSFTLSADRFETKNAVYKYPREILNSIAGTFSKEDLKRIEKYYRHYISQCNDFVKTRTDISNSLLNAISSCCLKSEKEKNKFLCSPEKIPAGLKKELKGGILKLYAINKIDNAAQSVYPMPYSNWFDTNFGTQNRVYPHSLFSHPRDKVLALTGAYVKEDIESIKKEEQRYMTMCPTEIWGKKLEILDNLQKYLSSAQADFIGAFSDKELKKLKKLAIKYEALNNVQKAKGIFSKDLESVIYSSEVPANIKKGDYINGLGLVTNRLKADGKDAVIVFSDIEKSRVLRMYNLESLNKKSVFISELPENLEVSDINGLNNKASELINMEKDSVMSEIRFSTVLSDIIKHLPDKSDEMAELAEKNKSFYFISDFLNHDKKRYPASAKIIGIRLLKLLEKNGCKPVFLRALAYNGSKHSPVNLYSRIGFKPFSHTSEELQQILVQNNGRFPYDMPVYMYLKDFDKERISALAKIYSLTD